jgi:hypothetical protein
MSSPSFLLANETNHDLLNSLLESMNAIVEHKYKENTKFLTGLLKSRKRFEALRNFTLEGGQAEIERQSQRRKEAVDGAESMRSPTREISLENLRSPISTRTPSLSNVPEESSAFAIGDDEDSENDDHEAHPTPSQSSQSFSSRNSRTPSVSSVDAAVPAQLRGMSEKARGKMPADKPSFSRVNSMTSMNSNVPPTPGIGFVPSPHWVSVSCLTAMQS